MKEKLSIRLSVDKEGFQQHEIIKNSNTCFTIGGILIALALLVGVIILIEDLIFVLTSYGTWNIFLEKLFYVVVGNIAFVALVNGKIGINISFTDTTMCINLKRIVRNISLFIASLGLLAIGIVLAMQIVENTEYRVYILFGFILLFGLSSIVYHLIRNNDKKALHSFNDLWGGIQIALFVFILIWGIGYISDTYKTYMYGTTNDNDIVCIKDNKGLYISSHQLYEGNATYPYMTVYKCTNGTIEIDVELPSPDY